MPMHRVPGTPKVIFLPKHSGDHVINLKEFPDLCDSIKKEDVPIVGSWKDYEGSGTRGPQEVMFAGLANEEFGNLHAQIDDIDVEEVTNRGNRQSTHRTRNKLVYIDKT